MPSPTFASTAPGLESILATELVELGFSVQEVELGGVSFDATDDGLAMALLWLRTANRVTRRLASFRARTFAELERHAAEVDWLSVVPSGAAVHFRVTSKKSRLYHQDAIAERLAVVATASSGATDVIQKPSDAAELEGDVSALPTVQRIVVRVHRDQVSISADASGASLHRRGYRLETAKAPLRETLAAAMVIASEWQSEEPFLDPLAGSGTLPIEAAMIARGLAPGKLRRFAAENWPGMKGSFERSRKLLSERELPHSGVRIFGSDRDPGAVMAAIANAERAGVVLDLSLSRGTLSEVPADSGAGLVLTNPPYGVRVGNKGALRDLYASFGTMLRERLPNWRVGMLSTDRILQGQVGVPMREVWRSNNGGLPIRFVRSD